MTPRKVTDKAQLAAFDKADGTTTSKYPWAEWTDGSTYQVTRDDYKGKPESMRYLLRAQAQKRQLQVKIQTLDDGAIMFRFSPKTEETTTETK